MIKKTLLASAFAVAAPVAALAAPVPICGPGATPGPYDIATGDTFLCELVFSGADAIDGMVRLDFESSMVPAAAVAATVNLGGAGSSFTTATLEWFDSPGDVSLGSETLSEIAGIGFGGSASTKFDGPGVPDQQYAVLSWTGFSSTSDVLQVSVQVDATPIPVPAAGFMLASVLGGAAVARRMKKKKAA